MTTNPFLDLDRQILADAGTSSTVDDALFHLCDCIGARFAGTPGYREAADFMLRRFESCALDAAYLEPFEFPAWERMAPASCDMLSPISRTLPARSLPYAAATQPEGLEAELVDVGDGAAEVVDGTAEQIAGRLVLTTAKARHRQNVYEHCREKGAVGFVLGGTIPGGILGTGMVADVSGGGIPAISVSHEDRELLQRQLKHDVVRLRVTTQCRTRAATTWNVVGEVTGSEFPDELVVVGGHLDSHDVGPCAYDNGAGAVVVMEIARLLGALRGRLRRTVRFVGFAGEEIGLLGSHHHAAKHAEALRNARFMLNCDMPSLGKPRGVAFHDCPKGEAYVKALSEQMETPLVCMNRAHCHSDHYPFICQGLPTAGVAGGSFAPPSPGFYHTAADTPEKISLIDLRDCAAFAARFLLRAANDDQWPDMRRSDDDIKAFQEKTGAKVG